MSSTEQSNDTKCVLTIDDDGTILKVIDSVLTLHSYESVTATQWVEAIDAMTEHEPDLLLLDLDMPHVDGIFLLEWIREQKLEIPVIVVSGYVTDESEARVRELGVKGIVHKPFEVSKLIDEVSACIGGGSVASAPGPESEHRAMGETAGAPDSVADESDLRPARRRRRSHRKTRRRRRERRRTMKYLALVAAVSVLVSGVTMMTRYFATSVSEYVRSEVGTPTDGADREAMIKDLIRAQIRTEIDAAARTPAKKPIEFKIQPETKQ